MAKPIVKRLKTKYYYCSNLVYDNDNISAILFDGGYASVDDDNGIVMHFRQGPSWQQPSCSGRQRQHRGRDGYRPFAGEICKFFHLLLCK